MKYYSLNKYLRETFKDKVYKICINTGCTCPNRDGTVGSGGCIFCSKGGSGDFAEDPSLTVTQQIENGKARVKNKIKSGKYIAYFQAYTNTYAPINDLRKNFYEAITHPDIVAVSIATRPDCLGDDVLDLLAELNTIKPVFVELGLQTILEKTAQYIRRGYTLDVYDKAVNDLKKIGINIVTHIILGLPGETADDMLESVKYVCDGRTNGIKLQLLYVLKGTDLEKDYLDGKFKTLEFDQYLDILRSCLEIIPGDVVVHRVTGDGAKKDLVSPLWSANKKKVLNAINKL